MIASVFLADASASTAAAWRPRFRLPATACHFLDAFVCCTSNELIESPVRSSEFYVRDLAFAQRSVKSVRSAGLERFRRANVEFFPLEYRELRAARPDPRTGGPWPWKAGGSWARSQKGLMEGGIELSGRAAGAP